MNLEIDDILIAPDTHDSFGAYELKIHYSKNYSIGLIIAIIFHFILIGGFYLIESLSDGNEEDFAKVKVMKYIELGPPPSITNITPELPAAAPKIKPKLANPVPAPKEKVPAEQTIATQKEASQEGTQDGTPVQVTPPVVPPVKVEKKVEEPPHYYAAVDEMPVPIGGITAIQSKIVYTEDARKAGIEGKIYLKAFIDERGIVNKVIIQKGLGAGLDEAALRAVKETRFKPGKQVGKPVKVQLVLAIDCKLK
jgi:TonB family protein